jgi:hypothetical protein
MSLGIRDNEAFELLGARTFADTSLVALEIEMQTRRVTLHVYGKLHGGVGPTYAATITFFGVEALDIGANDVFPQRAGISLIELTHDDADDTSSAIVNGTAEWSIGFRFDGLSFEETPAVIASLADED